MRRVLSRIIIILITVAVVGLPNGVIVVRDGSGVDGKERGAVGYVDDREVVEGERGHDWLIETVDSVGEIDSYASIAVDSKNRPHIVYMNRSDYYIYYAFFDWDKWHFEMLEEAGVWGGRPSIAVDADDRPHIVYSTYWALVYGHHNGIIWKYETVDTGPDLGYDSSIDVDKNNRPHISYLKSSRLMYAYYSNDQWNHEIADSLEKVGRGASLKLDSNDLPHISYLDYDSNRLRYAYNDSHEWKIHTVDTDGDYRYYTSLALDTNDLPHIAYYDNENKDLEYAHFDEHGWHKKTVDSERDVGRCPSIDIDKEDLPHIAYYDESDGNLKYAYLLHGIWQIETVDATGNVGETPSLALDGNDVAHISYKYGDKLDLKYATILDREPPESVVECITPYWTTENLIRITVNATDLISGIRNVTLWYRYSIDNTTWQDWIQFGRKESPPYTFDFPFPYGNGYYEFNSSAVDLRYNIEPDTESGTAKCGYDTEIPQANAGVDAVITVGSTLFLDGSVSKDNTEIALYSWHFDDDGPQILNGMHPNYTFDNVGIFEVTLKVVDAAGFRDIDMALVTVYDDIPPVAEAGED